MRRLFFTASLLVSATVAPLAAQAQTTNDTRSEPRSFEMSVPRVAPSTAIAAVIRIDKLRVRANVYVGVSMAVFDKGVGQWPGTPRPGQVGNIVLGGHRTSGLKPFADIDKLVPGDIIALVTKGIAYHYAVTKKMIVKPTAMWITDPTPTATLTLFACHPKGKTTQRYVVRASLVK